MSPESPSRHPDMVRSQTSERELQELGRRVAERRTDLGLTLAALAEAVGVHHSTLSRLERGVQDLGASRIPALARALQWSVANLFGSD